MTKNDNKNTEIKGYTILGKLAKGGMGEVYKAIHKGLNKEVILKKLMPKSPTQFFERFKREAQIMMEISHPNVVHIFDYFEYENSPYIVMEYVPGYNLSELIKKYGQIPVYVACYIALEVAKGLEYAHNKGIVHRDIKPGNVLISNSGEIKLTDFGIAFKSNRNDIKDITKTGTLLGTPAYMSPEQIYSAKDVDESTDQYGLGIIFYEMLTGVRPFSNEFNMANIVNIRKGRCKSIRTYNKNVPFWLVKIVKKLMNPKKSRRYKNITEFIKEISFWLKLKFNNLQKLKEDFSNFINNKKVNMNYFKYSYLLITLSFLKRIFTPLIVIFIVMFLMNFISPNYIEKLFYPNSYGFLDIEINASDKIDFFTLFLKSKSKSFKYTISPKETNNYYLKDIVLPVDTYQCYLKINNIFIPKLISIQSYKKIKKNKIIFNIRAPENKEIDIFLKVKDLNNILNNYTLFYKPVSKNNWIEYKGEKLITGLSYDFYVTKSDYENGYLNDIYLSPWQDKIELDFLLIEKRSLLIISKVPFDLKLLINNKEEYTIDKKGLKLENIGILNKERKIFLKKGKYNFTFINKKRNINVSISKVIEKKDYLVLFDFNESKNKLKIIIK